MFINRYREEKLFRALLLIAIVITLSSLFSILFHIISRGISVINWEFITGYPEDMGRSGGVFPAIVGTFYIILVSIAVAAPVGILAAVYLTEYTRQDSKLVRIIRFATETLAGIPSIVFGLFGFAFLVIYLKLSWSIISGSLTLACMILPTIIRTAEEAIKAVPYQYREGSLALGATQWQTIYKIVLPAALPGIITGIILSIGRVVGETAAVLLTAGSSLNLPGSIFDPARTLSIHLYLLTFDGISFQMAYGTATILIILILIINSLANFIMRKMSTGHNC
ncbi:phosphate ABC transporter permease PstA [Desulfurispora thermophila]|uniref:phosphate ABC transporter permease PstA n=1 Tax=Desulfurispora thermophila TaxID=265470 RepID=UPI000366A5D7|nr:phosphate ABC transporter permease PstA [Desulfurispora thermophila]